MAYIFRLKYTFKFGEKNMDSVNICLRNFLELNLAEVTRKLEHIEKDRAFYLARRKRIEDNLEELRTYARLNESKNNHS